MGWPVYGVEVPEINKKFHSSVCIVYNFPMILSYSTTYGPN